MQQPIRNRRRWLIAMPSDGEHLMMRIVFAAPIIGLIAVGAMSRAEPTMAQISPYLADNPNDLSGMQHTRSHKGYQQFDFDTVDLEALKKRGGGSIPVKRMS